MEKTAAALIDFLNSKVKQFNQVSFIKDDPVCVPHLFSKKQDIEIAGFFSAIFAWGNRTTIINKSTALMAMMDNSPFEFVKHHSVNDLRKLLEFKHRTFNATDLLYFIDFLKMHYAANLSLEEAFTTWMFAGDQTIENALTGFYRYFFSLEDAPPRTQKHIASPARKSTCKRLCR